MKKMTLILCIAALAACKRSDDKSDFEGRVAEVAMAPPISVTPKLKAPEPVTETEMADDNAIADVQPVHQPEFASDTSRKIVKNGEISFETDDVPGTRKTILETTRRLKGYLADETESGFENGRKDYTLNLKVPAKHFDALLDAISSTAHRIDSKNIRIEDITAQYIDTRTRISNKKLLEKRYLELLTKAVRITDMLAIEDKLSEIRSDIESSEGQFMLMKRQVAYSSISITFYSKAIAQETGKGFWYRISASLRSGWEFLQQLFLGLVSVWPLVIVIGVGYAWLRSRKLRGKTL